MKQNGLIIAFLITLFGEDFFVFMMMTLDVLPLKFVLPILGVLVAVDIAVAMLLFKKKYISTMRMLGLVIVAFLLNILLLGSYVMFSTYVTLDNISKLRDHYEKYDVVALKDGSYKNEKDIKNQNVYAYDSNSKMYMEAMNKLKVKASVKYDMEKDCAAVADRLIDKEGNSHDVLIFIPDNNYQVLCEEDKKINKKTEVIYSVEVMKRGSDNAARVDVTEDPFNICITGIDMWGKIDQVSRSDVNMIVTVNPQTRTILLTSMPRDSYVVLHSFGEYDKLTHSGVWGVDETINTLQDWLDVDLNYYVRLDFSMLVHIVHEIGGIDVYSDYDFESSISDHFYHKGWNHVYGMGALYFARERHAFKNEDQQRIINQQRVMKACLKKVMSSETLLSSYTRLLKVVEGEMETNLSEKEMASLVRMQLNDMRGWKIKTQSVQGDLTMKGTYTMGMGRELTVSIPREKSVEKVKKKIQETMYPTQDLFN